MPKNAKSEVLAHHRRDSELREQDGLQNTFNRVSHEGVMPKLDFCHHVTAHSYLDGENAELDSDHAAFLTADLHPTIIAVGWWRPCLERQSRRWAQLKEDYDGTRKEVYGRSDYPQAS